jgi:hypothetical protein
MTSPRDTLRAALDPKSVAIVGASQDPNKIGESRGLVSRRPVCGEASVTRSPQARLREQTLRAPSADVDSAVRHALFGAVDSLTPVGAHDCVRRTIGTDISCARKGFGT